MNTALRERFISDGVATVSQEQLLLALYDRLLNDLEKAETYMETDTGLAHDALVHAQRIVEELHLALDPRAWEGAEHLSDIYLFAHEQLVEANLRKDGSIVSACRQVLEPLA